MSEFISEKSFEQIVKTEYSRDMSETCLKLGKVAIDFARVERVPRYNDGKRESDVEHSYMLALIAPELAQRLELTLDAGLISQFAIVHDLIELKTNDIPTLLLNEETDSKQKEREEQLALSALLAELPPHTATMLARYELQVEQEARFVRFVDKLLPLIVDIIGSGKRVMHEDYHLDTKSDVEQAHLNVNERLVRQFGNEFEGIGDTHKTLGRLFRDSFDE